MMQQKRGQLNNLSSSFELNLFSRIQPFFHELLFSVNAQIDHCATVYCNDSFTSHHISNPHLSVSDVFSKFTTAIPTSMTSPCFAEL
jgi:hypothetical protein